MIKKNEVSKAPFYSAPCLSIDLASISWDDLHSNYFNKKTDWRFPEQAIKKFIEYNKSAFKFLGISVKINGYGPTTSIRFVTSNYIGAIPTRMPYNGNQGGDIQIYPRFTNKQEAFAKISDLLTVLKYSIEPEFMDSLPLRNNNAFRPPLYYDASKYVDMFEDALKHSWNKFELLKRNNNYPKSSTDWNRYARNSANPYNMLIYPSRDNVLSTIHPEWQQLRYVFDLASHELTNRSTPNRIRHKYSVKINGILSRIYNVPPIETTEMRIHISDPSAIKSLKKQANTILTRKSTVSTGWRIDIAALFERFVQHVVAEVVKEMGGKTHCNPKISSSGELPLWGLRYLEPDIIIEFDNMIIVADAKYKANFYSYYNDSNILKDTHRDDLHQLLSYCSFAGQQDKNGILFYPSNEFGYKRISYHGRIGQVTNTVLLVGIPFEVDSMADTKKQLKIVLNNIVN